MINPSRNCWDPREALPCPSEKYGIPLLSGKSSGIRIAQGTQGRIRWRTHNP